MKCKDFIVTYRNGWYRNATVSIGSDRTSQIEYPDELTYRLVGTDNDIYVRFTKERFHELVKFAIDEGFLVL